MTDEQNPAVVPLTQLENPSYVEWGGPTTTATTGNAFTPLADEADTVEADVVKYYFSGGYVLVRRRFKRMRFLRMINTDPIEALAMATGEEEMARLEELDLDEAQFNELMETISNGIGGGTRGNSGPSPR